MSLSENIKKNKLVSAYTETPDFKNGLLNIEVSGKCNEKCVYCPYSASGLHENAGFIDSDFFYRITKEAKELGITRVGLYMRGEPLCNPKVYEYVDYLKHDLGFDYVYISTNGLLLNEKNMEKLAKAGIDSIKFSIAGYDKLSFFQHHGVDGYDIVNKNIENAYKYRENNGYHYSLGMFIVVTSQNVDYLTSMKEYYGQYCDEVLSDYVINEGPLRMNGLELLMNTGEVNEIIDKKIPCNQLFNRIAIDDRGYLLICCYSIDGFTRVLDLSNISLKDGVYSEKMKYIRRMHLLNTINNSVCAKCVFNSDDVVYKFSDMKKEFAHRIDSIDYETEIRKRFGMM